MKLRKIDNTSFKAREVAGYSVLNGAVKRRIKIYGFEHSDIPLLQHLQQLARNNALIPQFATQNEKLNSNLSTLTRLGFKEIEKSLALANEHKLPNIDTIGYIAVANDSNKPDNHLICGLVVGNIPKIDLLKGKIYRSDRARAGETELEYLTAWSPNEGESLKGIGAALTIEFMQKAIAMIKGLKTIYLRSTTDKCHPFDARPFYEKLGFKVTDGGEKLPKGKLFETFDRNRPRSITAILDPRGYIEYTNVLVEGREISVRRAKKVVETKARELYREEPIENTSVDLSKLLHITIPEK